MVARFGRPDDPIAYPEMHAELRLDARRRGDQLGVAQDVALAARRTRRGLDRRGFRTEDAGFDDLDAVDLAAALRPSVASNGGKEKQCKRSTHEDDFGCA